MATQYLYKAPTGSLVSYSFSGSLVNIDGFPAQDSKLISTTFSLTRGQDVEYQKTLSRALYAFAFGESVGQVKLGGLLFFSSCDSGANAESVDAINSFYEENNVYEKSEPLIIGIGGLSLDCYLEAMAVSVESSEFNYGNFSLVFSKIPKVKK